MKLPSSGKLLCLFYIVIDFICFILSVGLAYGLYQAMSLGKQVVYSPSQLLIAGCSFGVGGVVVLALCGAYNSHSDVLNVTEIRRVLIGMFLYGGAIGVAFFFAKFNPSRAVTLLSVVVAAIGLVFERSLLYRLFSDGRLGDFFKKNVIIYGAGQLGQTLYREFANSPRLGAKVIGFVDDDEEKRTMRVTQSGFNTHSGAEVLGTGANLSELVKENRVKEVCVAISHLDDEKLQRITHEVGQNGTQLSFVPNLYKAFLHRVELEQVGNLPLVRELGDAENRSTVPKRILDLAISVPLFILLLPLLLSIALLIRCESSGPALFRQKRVGKGGVVFTMYKFRSMTATAEPYAENPFGDDDPRITRVGRFLRKLSLDELPQLFNVIKGDMSLVGPRPEMPFIVEQYDELHRERLKVLPGITGLWQLSGDRKRPIHENMDYDLFYIHHQSLTLDLTILLQTLLFAFKGV